MHKLLTFHVRLCLRGCVRAESIQLGQIDALFQKWHKSRGLKLTNCAASVWELKGKENLAPTSLHRLVCRRTPFLLGIQKTFQILWFVVFCINLLRRFIKQFTAPDKSDAFIELSLIHHVNLKLNR